MPLLVRQRKEKKVRGDHPVFNSGEPQKLIDRDRERDMPKVRRNLIAIIAVMVLIAIIIIAGIIAAMTASSDNSPTRITAADTFAITPYEQQEMTDKASNFARYMAIWAYCSDQSTALEAKNAALDLIVPGTKAYSDIEAAPQVYPVIAPENFVPVVTEPLTSNSGEVLASSLSFTCDAAAADKSVTSDQNPSGTFADPGLRFKITFEQATDEAVERKAWMISEVSIRSKSATEAPVDENGEPISQQITESGDEE